VCGHFTNSRDRGRGEGPLLHTYARSFTQLSLSVWHAHHLTALCGTTKTDIHMVSSGGATR
jgi:hypothetical protein